MIRVSIAAAALALLAATNPGAAQYNDYGYGGAMQHQYDTHNNYNSYGKPSYGYSRYGYKAPAYNSYEKPSYGYEKPSYGYNSYGYRRYGYGYRY